MMRYRVIEAFTDLTDNKYLYGVGDSYPRAGLKPSAERIEMLLTTKNPHHRAFIKEEGDGENGCDVCDNAGHSDADPTADNGGAEQSRKSPANRKRKAKDNSK